MNIVKALNRRLQKLLGLREFYFPPGHFYTPLNSQREIAELGDNYFNYNNIYLQGITLDKDKIEAKLNSFSKYYKEFTESFVEGSSKYDVKNGFYTYSDAIFLFSFLMDIKPNNLIEIGSGYSSLLTIETDRIFLNNKIKKYFIEPYPEERLLGLLKGNESNMELIARKVQNIPQEFFKKLEQNDILFIDSSHVSKMGSDLNYLLFEVLPTLKSGVYIHFHDIFYPFDYPKEWAQGNRWSSWNEAYILRAFLMYNTQFEIVFWNSYCEKTFPDLMLDLFPSYYLGGSASIWLKKL